MTLKFENPGYVYILSNESLKGLKIGYTQNSPYDRSADLFTTGVPTPFVVEHFFFVENAPLCEELVHTRLNRYRIDDSREFFRVDVPRAMRAVEQAIDDLRERLWAKNELHVFKDNTKKFENNNKGNNEPVVKQVPLVNQSDYKNPKFKEMIKVMKETYGLMTQEDIAKKVGISPEGVGKIIKMMQGIQGSQILYSREENRVKKYSVALSFNVEQLTLLSERFPLLELMELEPLFNKPKNNYKNKNQNGYKPRTKEQNSGQTVSEFIKEKVENEKVENKDKNISNENENSSPSKRDPLSRENLNTAVNAARTVQRNIDRKLGKPS